MSEKEIRRVIEEICADLDRHARILATRGVRKVVLPAVVGASLALGGCDRAVRMMYGVPVPDGGKVKDKGTAKKDGKVPADLWPVYMAPDRGPTKTDKGAQPDYMAPDARADLPPTPPYMAPDAGPTPPYMAPDVGPDKTGPTPLYMGPQPKDDGGKK